MAVRALLLLGLVLLLYPGRLRRTPFAPLLWAGGEGCVKVATAAATGAVAREAVAREAEKEAARECEGVTEKRRRREEVAEREVAEAGVVAPLLRHQTP